MQIGIIGSGIVAQTLGAGFLKHGDQVVLGTRSPDKLDSWQAENPLGKVGSFEDAARFGELVVLAVRGSAAEQALRASGQENLRDKTVIDATNPIADDPPQDGVLSFFTGLDESLLERLQAAFPEARLVKAFNSVGAGRMVNPDFPEGRPSMFICGNDEGARNQVAAVLDRFGWDTEDMGTAKAARAIEPLCMLWCIPGFRNDEWGHAFKMLR